MSAPAKKVPLDEWALDCIDLKPGERHKTKRERDRFYTEVGRAYQFLTWLEERGFLAEGVDFGQRKKEPSNERTTT